MNVHRRTIRCYQHPSALVFVRRADLAWRSVTATAYALAAPSLPRLAITRSFRKDGERGRERGRFLLFDILFKRGAAYCRLLKNRYCGGAGNLFAFIFYDVSALQAKASGAGDFFTGTNRISTRRSRAAAIRLSIAIECPS